MKRFKFFLFLFTIILFLVFPLQVLASTTPSPMPEGSPPPEAPLPLNETPGITPTPTPKVISRTTPGAEGEAGLILTFSRGQAIIGGFIFLALIGAGIAFAAYSRRKPAKKPKESAKGESRHRRDKRET